MTDGGKLYGINRLRETMIVAESTRRSMQGNRSRETKPEVTLRSALWHSGLRGYRKNVRHLPGTPDIVYGRSKLVIFVHGCFWHGHDCGPTRIPKKNREFWTEKFRLNQERHERNLSKLAELGYKTITVWECEMKLNVTGIIELVRKSLDSTP